MGLIDTIRTLGEVARQWPAIRAQRAASAPEWFANAIGADSGLPDLGAMRNQAKAYTWSSWVTSAINIVNLTCKASKLNVVRMQGEKRIQIDAHALERRMNDPNPLDTGVMFQDAMLAWQRLTGNCYVWLNRESETAEPAELWILPSYEVQPHPDGRLSIDGYHYKPTGTGQDLFIPPWQMMHWHGFNPNTPFVGASMVEVLASTVKTDYAQSKWNERNFGKEQGKVPGVLAFPDPIPDGLWEKIKNEFYSSQDREGPRRHVLLMRNTGTGTPKWVSTYMSPAEMQFMESRRYNMEEIYSVLAPGFYTMISENSTEANSRVGAEVFKSYCYGLLVDLGQRITKAVLPAYGRHLVAEFDDVRDSDRELELAEMTEYAKTHTIDEVREKFYEDTPLGDDRGKMLVVQLDWRAPEPTFGKEDQAPQLVPSQLQQPQQEQPSEPQPGEQESAEGPPPEEEANAQEDDSATRAIVADLRTWRRVVKRRGKPYDFESEHIPPRLKVHLYNALVAADDTDEMLAVFDEFLASKSTARFLPLGADDPRLPVPDGDVTISERDIEAAMKSWDKAFPELAGILDAQVIGQDQFDATAR